MNNCTGTPRRGRSGDYECPVCGRCWDPGCVPTEHADHKVSPAEHLQQVFGGRVKVTPRTLRYAVAGETPFSDAQSVGYVKDAPGFDPYYAPEALATANRLLRKCVQRFGTFAGQDPIIDAIEQHLARTGEPPCV